MFDTQFVLETKKYLFRLFLGVLIGLIGLAISSFIISEIQAASFKLDPEVVSTESGEEFDVNVFIDTGKVETDGADIVLKYNSEILEVLEIIPGEIYYDYPIREAFEGTVKITGLANSSGPFFSGNELFATVKFKAKFGGEETISIEFTNDSTTDSNIAIHGSGTDALTEIGESILYIGGEPPPSSLVSGSVVSRILLAIVYVIIIVVVGYFGYKWWLKRRQPEYFIPEQAPMDKPPSSG